MKSSPDRSQCGWSGLALSQLLALAFLTGCLWWVVREAELILPNDRITASLSLEQDLGTRLPRQLFAFGAVLFLCHALLGLFAFGLARLTEAACAGRPPAKRGWLVAGWFTWLTGLVMAANATWYPGSRFADTESWLLADTWGFRPVEILLAASGLFVLILLLRAAQRRIAFNPGLTAGIAGAAALALISSVALPRASAGRSPAAAGNSAPHVVIIGVDSLRSDLTESRSGASVTPHIDAYLAAAHRFPDTTTPLARTYASWVTILTGRHPVSTNARVNLIPRRLVHAGVTLPEVLRSRGYQTVYSTDEVRFANIDESFGFDQLITPPIGAADFLLGYAGDMPLANLVAASRAGDLLFPSSHANRAAHVTYQPDDYVERLADEIVVDGPAMLAIHLTLAHWPASWAGMPTPSTFQEYRPAYRLAIEEVDRQFDAVMRLLEDKGVLENAIVVLLSDHGEALGGETDSMLRKTGTSREIWDSLWGHGTSVMSPHQYNVLLAMRAFGRARLPGSIGIHDWPVSLEDVRPTLEEYVTGKAPADVDGISLLPYLDDPSRAQALASRIRFTETDFNTPNTLAGRYEASGLIDEAAVFYELDRESGWVQFREARLPELMAQKQRAAMSSQTLLAAIPGAPGQGPRYLLTERRNPLPRGLEGPPDPAAETEARRLWDALHARFPGELPAPPAEPRM
jgi:arylsulfatase A-like enzyme